MAVERAYNRIGLPAYVMVTKSAKKGAVGARVLVYPTDASFDRLWAKGTEPQAAIVAPDNVSG